MSGALARVWLAAAALAAGAWLGAEGGPAVWGLAPACTGALLLLRRRSLLAALGIVALAFGLGWFSATARTGSGSPLATSASSVPRCEVAGRVLETAGGLGTVASIESAVCAGHADAPGRGVVVIDGDIGAAGSTFVAHGWLLPLGDDPFDAARRRLGADASFDTADMEVEPPGTGPLRVAFLVKQGLVRATQTLEPRRAALLRGLSLGDTRALDAGTIEGFRRAGLSHLLAVSGSNVAIVLGAVALLLRALPLWLKLSVALGALVLFVLVVGPEASVLRAAVMGAIGLAALAYGRRAEPLHALGLALIAVVAARPYMVFSVGLHLSAAATAGLVLWTSPLARMLPFLPRPARIALGATLAAQLAVAPILVATFGELSLASPAANLLALPAVPPSTVLALGAALMGPVHLPTARLLATMAEPFAGWILAVGDLYGARSWASLDVARWWGWPLAAPVALAAALSLRRIGRSDL
ncbi:MAG: ComEC/Rec2 family competence protein [Actinomycetota bacterium]